AREVPDEEVPSKTRRSGNAGRARGGARGVEPQGPRTETAGALLVDLGSALVLDGPCPDLAHMARPGRAAGDHDVVRRRVLDTLDVEAATARDIDGAVVGGLTVVRLPVRVRRHDAALGSAGAIEVLLDK